jgi:hypothetical protein
LDLLLVHLIPLLDAKLLDRQGGKLLGAKLLGAKLLGGHRGAASG